MTFDHWLKISKDYLFSGKTTVPSLVTIKQREWKTLYIKLSSLIIFSNRAITAQSFIFKQRGYKKLSKQHMSLRLEIWLGSLTVRYRSNHCTKFGNYQAKWTTLGSTDQTLSSSPKGGIKLGFTLYLQKAKYLRYCIPLQVSIKKLHYCIYCTTIAIQIGVTQCIKSAYIDYFPSNLSITFLQIFH